MPTFNFEHADANPPQLDRHAEGTIACANNLTHRADDLIDKLPSCCNVRCGYRSRSSHLQLQSGYQWGGHALIQFHTGWTGLCRKSTFRDRSL